MLRFEVATWSEIWAFLCFFSTCWLQETVNDAKPPRREADFRGAKLLSSPSISASHHSAQRQSECELQAAALTNSTACYQPLLAACQYRLCLRLLSQLLAAAERLGEGRKSSPEHRGLCWVTLHAYITSAGHSNQTHGSAANLPSR